MKKTIILTITVLTILWLSGFYLWNDKVEAKQDDKQVFLEKWTLIWEYKYTEIEASKTMQDAKAKKDKLLEELNTPKWDWSYFWADKWFYPWDTGNSLGKIQ